ncbi:HD domain-containing protein [Dendrosporobacter sp. 1207_IL3150]|uniref:HD domain-containing protein n=1 Tax=Dendrosporobacter sp. 1207_IL3150 TaxID=3084054 RepID=UPI002FD8B284
MDIRERWDKLLLRLNSNPIMWEKVYRLILLQYTDAKRTYHNIEHLNCCFRHFDKVKTLLTNPDAVEFALWFHDFVYVPSSVSNEVLSANIARKYCRDFLGQENFGEEVFQLIIATKHLETTNLQDDCEFIADIDLAILGADLENFVKYENNIRKEYSFLGEKQYRSERLKVLSSFIMHDYIYLTPYFRKSLEDKARRNISCLIKCLNK